MSITPQTGQQKLFLDVDPFAGDDVHDPQHRLEEAIGPVLARQLLRALTGGYRARPGRLNRSSP